MLRNDNSNRFFISRFLFGSSLRNPLKGGVPMLDIVLLALGLGFFVISIGYAYACDRL